jgi:hypothetical protein
VSYAKFVTGYHRYTHAPRSLDQAFKTADYATPIWRCETEQEKGLSNMAMWMIPISMLVLFAFVIYPTILLFIEGTK